MTIYGYARVSTKTQQRDGNSLSVQREQLQEAGCTVVVEEAYTGTTTDRPKFDRLLESLKSGDTLTVAKLDRMARSTVEGCTLVRDLIAKGITVRVLNMGTLDATPVGKVMVSVMFAMAEFERDMIVQRTQEGRAAAKLRPGYREGRPKKEVDISELRHHMALVEAGKETVADACLALGIGRTKYYELRRKAA
ncbi:recombinase family protein [Collinsella sp. AGMB00827]|uniref:Recombinase family protein n=1 Tax=Collinsella ureilytica TaxID=2869515 RepID=A0ABS7MLU6_9ACTN|nr:recombinase family protein [Collinsella urealyticum]MBY4798342.1 recombinase family protein [Collinsella urealyticum]